MTDIAAMTPLMIERETSAATLWLDAPHQPVVVLDSILLDRLEEAIAALEADPPACLLVRSRDERVWIAGADLKEIDALSDDDLDAYMARGQQVMLRLAALPCPVVACVHGATLGGGLELALHCNGIVVSTHNGRGKPYPVGLPETSLGLLPAWGGTQRLPARIDPGDAVAAITSGRPFSSDALPAGLADAVVDTPDELHDAALRIAAGVDGDVRDLGACDASVIEAAVAGVLDDDASSQAGRAAAACTAAGAADGRAAGQVQERERIVALRRTDDTRARLHAFLNKSA